MGSATEKYEGLIASLNAYRSVFIPFSLSCRVYGVRETLSQLDEYAVKLSELKEEYESKLSKGDMSLESYLETFSRDAVEEWVWCVIEEAPHLETIYETQSQWGSSWTEKTGEQMTKGYCKGFWLRQSLANDPQANEVYGLNKVLGAYGSAKPTPNKWPKCELRELDGYQQFLTRGEIARESSRKGLNKVQEVEEKFFNLRLELEALIQEAQMERKAAAEQLALKTQAKETKANQVVELKKAGKPIPRNLR